ncbi:MAG TPA: GNAT family N-acetyltransferase [Kofleriaceae bacterium]
MTISLRAATLDDCEQVWLWNFAADVRAMSNDPTIVELARHAAWFIHRISEGAFWIVLNDGVPVGNVRVDHGRISIALAAEARGYGVGKQAIALACAAYGSTVVAQIRFDNTRSRAAFEACGFVNNGGDTYQWSP